MNSDELSLADTMTIQGCLADQVKGKESICDDVSDTVMKSDLVIFRDKTYGNKETK